MNEFIQEVVHEVAAAEKDPNVKSWEQAVVEDFGMKLQLAFAQLIDLEKIVVGKKKPNPKTAKQSFLELFSRFVGIPVLARMPPGSTLGKAALKYLNTLWTTGLQVLQVLEEFVGKHKDILGVKDWSISTTIGFPIGVSGTIMVTFHK